MNTTAPTRSSDEAAMVTPRSIRYRLSKSELAAALQVAGLVPDATMLEQPASVQDPAAVLRSGEYLDATGALHPFLYEALAVVARPRRTVRVLATAPGADEWIDFRIGAAASSGPYVTLGQDDSSSVEVRAIDTSLEMAAVLDDVFRLSVAPTRPVDPDIMLTLPAWIGLLAIADVRRLRRLRSELRRQPSVDQPMSATDIAGAITVGLSGADARWAMSAALPVAPVDLRRRAPNASDVFDQLVTLDLARRVGDHIEATDLGNDLIEVMAQPMLLGSATLTHHRDSRPVRGGELLVYRGPTRLLLGLWTGTQEAPLLNLMEPTAEAAVAIVRGFIELTDAGDSRERPGTPATSASTRAAATGSTIPRESPLPPPFDASHRVGEQGVRVWPRPDPTAEPIGTLAHGTTVAVLSTRGAWAYVSTDADGEGWIDGRQLVEL